MEYQLCGQQMDCVTFRNSKEDCASGCYCTNDYVLEDGKCVNPTMCPGEFYKFLNTIEFNYECYSHGNVQVVGRSLQYCKVVLSLSQARLWCCAQVFRTFQCHGNL